MLQPRTAVPYSQCGEPSRGASVITVTIYASTLEQLEERFIQANVDRIIGDVSTENLNGRWIRRWKEDRPTLADVFSLHSWRNPRKKQAS